MRVDAKEENPAFQSLFANPNQVIFLDANFFIPPDRTKIGAKYRYKFDYYKAVWLEPLISEYSNLAIHESVYEEFVDLSVRNYVDKQIETVPRRLSVYADSDLSIEEMALMKTFIRKLAVHSQYDPGIDNKKDRGEVKTLAYMATRRFLYFAANDAAPIRWIKNAENLQTGLDEMGVVQMYELIYYLIKTGKYDNKGLRTLYKYMYYLSSGEKQNNPEWCAFIKKMDALYGEQIQKSLADRL